MADVLSELSFDESRLSLEQQAMNESFPEAKLVKLSGLESPLGWRLGIVIADTVHQLLVAYQKQFLEKPPELWVLNPEFDTNQTPHVTPNGRLVFSSTVDHGMDLIRHSSDRGDSCCKLVPRTTRLRKWRTV